MNVPEREKLSYAIVVRRGEEGRVLRVIPLTEYGEMEARERLFNLTMNLWETATLNETNWEEETTKPIARKAKSSQLDNPGDDWDLVSCTTFSVRKSR